MTVAEAVADWLAEKEIRHAFGIIGAGNLHLWEAIAKKKATELVAVHHEQAAVMAAGFYQRACGRTALALVTTGAGSTNAITGVMAAYMDSTPVLVFSGNEPLSSFTDRRVMGVQGYRTSEVARHFTKKSSETGSHWAVRHLDDFYQAAIEGRPGPVWLDIPRDIQVAPVR